MEQTFLMIKPDGVKRGLIGEIFMRMERKGFKLVGAKFFEASQEIAKEHYAEHCERPFFGELVDFITSGHVLAMVWSGENIISISRNLMGCTDPKDAAPGTIRGDFATVIAENIIHGSDSSESAEREIALWFSAAELSVGV